MSLGRTGEPGDSAAQWRKRARPLRWIDLTARFALLAGVFGCPRGLTAATWTRSFGDPGEPISTSWSRATTDGGVLVGGATGDDACLVKLDASGAVLWQGAAGDGSPC